MSSTFSRRALVALGAGCLLALGTPAVSGAGHYDSQIARGRELLERRAYAAAREVFQGVLASDPSNLEALLGMGDSYPRYVADELARPWYLKVLALDPGNKDALLALGIQDLATDRGSARERADALGQKHPAEASILTKSLDQVKAPLVSGTYYASSDNYSDVDTARLGFQTALSDRVDLIAGGEHIESRPVAGGQAIKADQGSVGVQVWAGHGQRLRLEIGGVGRAGSGSGTTDATFGASWDAGLGRRVRFRLGGSRSLDTFALTSLPRLFLVTTGSVGVEARAGQFAVEGQLHASDFSERGVSSRYVERGTVRYRLLIGGLLPVEVGYTAENVHGGQKVLTHRGQLRTYVGNGRLGLGVALEPLWRRYEGLAYRSKLTGSLGASLQLGGGLFLEGFHAFGDYRVGGVRLNWRGGPR